MPDFKSLISVDESVDASPSVVWDVATHKTGVMFLGAEVETDWHVGHKITFAGEWEGKPFKDKGVVMTFERERLLEFTHLSASSGKADVPENYNLVSIELRPEGERTHVKLTQSIAAGAKSPSAETVAKFEANWKQMLGNLKKTAETPRS